jgi:hypothetical protein
MCCVNYSCTCVFDTTPYFWDILFLQGSPGYPPSGPVGPPGQGKNLSYLLKPSSWLSFHFKIKQSSFENCLKANQKTLQKNKHIIYLRDYPLDPIKGTKINENLI